jgi:DNA (cytosine-5)-methyltransferase 1
MSAYYNENDKQTCAWLRELIKQNLIAPGDVDERDIRDVRSDDLIQYEQIHLFAGIGVWSYALRNAGWPDDRPVFTGSCPCQPFSSAGKKDGTKDKRHLWPEMFRLIAGLPESKRPPTIFGEQVAQKAGQAWFDALQADLARENYAAGLVVFPACSVGAPHLRQRLYWFADYVEQSNRDGRQQRATCHNDGRKRQRPTDQQNDRYKVWNDTGDTKPTDGMENTNSQRLKQQSILLQQKQGKDPQAAGRGSTDGVADNHCKGVERKPGNAANQSRAMETRGQGSKSVCKSGNNSPTDGVADGDGKRSQRHGQKSEQQQHAQGRQITSGYSAESCDTHGAGPINGYWRNADWIWCRDEKWRPTEPGLAPLVDGASARVVRLRGFGNAIVAPQAQAFIESYMETE